MWDHPRRIIASFVCLLIKRTMPSSYTSPLPETITPGWNDPPPSITGFVQSTTSNLPKKHRRPIDPSIQAVCFPLLDRLSSVHNNQTPPAYGNAALHQYGYSKGQQIVSIFSTFAEKLQTCSHYNLIREQMNCLHNYIVAARLPDKCVDQLHGVAIALHQGLYNDAMSLYEEMCGLFPLEVLNWGWGHGLKLMISELLSQSQQNSQRSYFPSYATFL